MGTSGTNVLREIYIKDKTLSWEFSFDKEYSFNLIKPYLWTYPDIQADRFVQLKSYFCILRKRKTRTLNCYSENTGKVTANWCRLLQTWY